MKSFVHALISIILALAITTPPPPVLAQRAAQILLHGNTRTARIIDVPGLSPSNPIVSIPLSPSETIHGASVGIPPTIPGLVLDQEPIMGRRSEGMEYMRRNLPPAGSARRARFGCYLSLYSRSARPVVFNVFYPLSRQRNSPVRGYDRLTCYVNVDHQTTTLMWIATEEAPGAPRDEKLFFVPMGDAAVSGVRFGREGEGDYGEDDDDDDDDDDGGADGVGGTDRVDDDDASDASDGEVLRIKEAHILDGPVIYTEDLKAAYRDDPSSFYMPETSLTDWAFCWLYDEAGNAAYEIRYATAQNSLDLLSSGLRCFGGPDYRPTAQHRRLD